MKSAGIYVRLRRQVEVKPLGWGAPPSDEQRLWPARTICAADCGCLAPVAARVNVTTYHNDVACTVSITGGTHDVLYIVEKHHSI